MDITTNHSSMEFVQEYAIKPGANIAASNFDPNYILKSDVLFYIFYSDMQEQLISSTNKISIAAVNQNSIGKVLSGMLQKFSPKYAGYPYIRAKMEEEFGKVDVLYDSGRLPALPIGVSYDERGGIELRAAEQRPEGTLNPLLVKSIHFNPNNIFGLQENIFVHGGVSIPLPPTHNLLRGLAFGIFLKEGSERILLTKEGAISDSLICIVIDGNKKNWPTKLNFPAGRDKITLFIDILNKSGNLDRVHDITVHLGGFLEIS